MKRLTVTAVLLSLLASATAELPPCYHSGPELYDAIFTMQDTTEWPERIKIDTIGYSQVNEIPLLAVKISDDAYTDNDRPVVAVFGPLHAEEITGIELTLQAMDILLNDPRPEYREIRTNAEVYFVPTMNPDGLNVVFGLDDDCVFGPDQSYRKNKRDAVDFGVFNYTVGWGNDSDGVDLNRNYDINWFHGDTLLHVLDETEPFDYYRGATPFSESETASVRDFIRDIRPLYSITLHDSRTGNFSSKCMYAWGWRNVNVGEDPRFSPDFDVIEDIAIEFTDHIGPPHFEPSPSGGRNGKMHDWMYAEGGWINMQTEMQENQPGCERLQEMIDEVLPSVFYLMHRSYADQTYITGYRGQIKTAVSDPDGNPLVAEVLLPDYNDGYLKPRMTDPVWGVNRRPMLPGQYQVVTRAFGFIPDTSLVTVGEYLITEHNVTLQPAPSHAVHIGLFDHQGNDLTGTLVVHRAWDVDTLSIGPGYYSAEWPEGSYTIEAWADGFYLPFRWSFDLDETKVFAPQLLGLSANTEIWHDDFETQQLPEHWSYEGDFAWGHSGMDKHTGIASLESDPAEMIARDASGSLMLTIDVPPETNTFMLLGWRAFELEPWGADGKGDFCYVDLSADGGEWVPLDTLNGMRRWHRFFYDLSDYGDASSIVVRWTITTDASLVDRGLFLDDLSLQATNNIVNAVSEAKAVPGKWALDSVYPNPFNPVTNVTFEAAVNARVSLGVYDILGREVMRLLDRRVSAGRHGVTLDMSDFASGVYFLRMDTPEFNAMKKIVLIK